MFGFSTSDRKSHRQTLASLRFEPPGSKRSESSKLHVEEEQSQEREARVVIECMKVALGRSIESISMPEKQRPLDPAVDFTIKTKIRFQKGPPTRSSGCCATQSVRHSRRSRWDDDETSSNSDSDHDDSVHKTSLDTFTFTDYSPMCYRQIREFFGIDPTQYRDVLVNSAWHHIPTPGKSAAQLFFCGQNWVIKTMTDKESGFLRTILHRYYMHCRDNSTTLLPHFVGHHALLRAGKKIVFVIMQNVFATPNKITEKFDLKGSTVGRHATVEERRKQTCTKKDLDISRPIVIGSKRRELLIEQLRRDCDLLRSCEIMDYSFLLGIHRVGETTVGLVKPKDIGLMLDASGAAFTADSGGMLSTDDGTGTPREIYYTGIIDILQEYNLWKRSETIVRGAVHNRHEISSVEPREYASRFVEFIASIVV